jgi:hypothetical protein
MLGYGARVPEEAAVADGYINGQMDMQRRADASRRDADAAWAHANDLFAKFTELKADRDDWYAAAIRLKAEVTELNDRIRVAETAQKRAEDGRRAAEEAISEPNSKILLERVRTLESVVEVKEFELKDAKLRAMVENAMDRARKIQRDALVEEIRGCPHANPGLFRKGGHGLLHAVEDGRTNGHGEPWRGMDQIFNDAFGTIMRDSGIADWQRHLAFGPTPRDRDPKLNPKIAAQP